MSDMATEHPREKLMRRKKSQKEEREKRKTGVKLLLSMTPEIEVLAVGRRLECDQ